MATIDELRGYTQNPNIRQFLDAIAQAEGTTGYDTAFGGGKIASLADHPRHLYDFTQTDGQRNKTSAAGRYQFLQGTWDDVAGNLGLSDFGPESQDIAAVELLRRNGSLDPLLAGDFSTAIKRSGATWASLPSSPYAQPKRSDGFMATALDKAAQSLFPSAQAGTLDDEWEALEKQYSMGAQPAQAKDDDPWADLEREFGPPQSVPAGKVVESVAPNGDSVRWVEDQPEPGGYMRQIGSGLLEGVTGVLGAPVDLTNAAIGLGMRGVNSLFGTDLQPSQEPLGGSAGLRLGLPIAPPSEDTGPQMARRVAQSVGGAAIPVAAGARTVQQLAAGLGTALGGGVGGATTKQMFPNNPWAEIAGELIGGLGSGATIGGLANRSTRRMAESSVPTVVQLRGQAADRFDEAHRLGVTASQAQTQQLASDIRNAAQREGLISPTGRVSEAYPKAREALHMLDDYAHGAMSVPQMQTVRKVLADAAGSPDAAERRIATIMLRRFDDFTAPLAPQLAEARGLYARAMRGEQLETLRELAGARAGQFTGSGYENALRTEYRNLDRRITRGQERGWTPEQIEAINRVSRGTGTSNTFRNIGRMAPTGVVSMGLGGGVPFMVGNALGGPVMGSALGAATMGGGFIARDLATRLGISYAEAAELLARNGGLLQGATNGAIGNSVARGLLGSVLAAEY